MADFVFKTVPIDQIRTQSAIAILRRDIWQKRYAAVLTTHQDEILGFLMYQRPKTIPVNLATSAPFTTKNLTLRSLTAWQRYDCVDLTLHTRSIAVFIPVKHQEWLPIPVIEEAVN